eukprot:7503241-Alexandrium_andersonii.AAC.1
MNAHWLFRWLLLLRVSRPGRLLKKCRKHIKRTSVLSLLFYLVFALSNISRPGDHNKNECNETINGAAKER